jgi:hypothetical protein
MHEKAAQFEEAGIRVWWSSEDLQTRRSARLDSCDCITAAPALPTTSELLHAAGVTQYPFANLRLSGRLVRFAAEECLCLFLARRQAPHP